MLIAANPAAASGNSSSQSSDPDSAYLIAEADAYSCHGLFRSLGIYCRLSFESVTSAAFSLKS
jgi:hypothetical protein